MLFSKHVNFDFIKVSIVLRQYITLCVFLLKRREMGHFKFTKAMIRYLFVSGVVAVACK